MLRVEGPCRQATGPAQGLKENPKHCRLRASRLQDRGCPRLVRVSRGCGSGDRCSFEGGRAESDVGLVWGLRPRKAQARAGLVRGCFGPDGVTREENKGTGEPGCLCSLTPSPGKDTQWPPAGLGRAAAGPGSLTGARGHDGLGAIAPQDGVGRAKVLASPQYLGIHTVAGPWGAVLCQEHGGPTETVGWRAQLGGCVLHKACGAGVLSSLEPDAILLPTVLTPEGLMSWESGMSLQPSQCPPCSEPAQAHMPSSDPRQTSLTSPQNLPTRTPCPLPQNLSRPSPGPSLATSELAPAPP